MEFQITGLSTTVALAAVALIGYLVGRRQRRHCEQLALVEHRLCGVNSLIDQVQLISDQLRRTMATHHLTVSKCEEQIRVLGECHAGGTDPSHHMNMQDVLAPTERLSDDIAMAYDELRRHNRDLNRLRAYAARR